MHIHDHVIKRKHLRRYWPFVRGIHRSPLNSPHKGQWRGASRFSLIWAWKNSWVNNRDAGELRHHRAYYDVTVMKKWNIATTSIHGHTSHIYGRPLEWISKRRDIDALELAWTCRINGPVTTYFRHYAADITSLHLHQQTHMRLIHHICIYSLLCAAWYILNKLCLLNSATGVGSISINHK